MTQDLSLVGFNPNEGTKVEPSGVITTFPRRILQIENVSLSFTI